MKRTETNSLEIEFTWRDVVTALLLYAGIDEVGKVRTEMQFGGNGKEWGKDDGEIPDPFVTMKCSFWNSQSHRYENKKPSKRVKP